MLFYFKLAGTKKNPDEGGKRENLFLTVTNDLLSNLHLTQLVTVAFL